MLFRLILTVILFYFILVAFTVIYFILFEVISDISVPLASQAMINVGTSDIYFQLKAYPVYNQYLGQHAALLAINDHLEDLDKRKKQYFRVPRNDAGKDANNHSARKPRKQASKYEEKDNIKGR